MLKIKDDVDLKELEKFGFKEYDGHYYYLREMDGVVPWRIDITNRHHNLQIRVTENCVIAKSLQTLIYDLTKAELLEKVEE